MKKYAAIAILFLSHLASTSILAGDALFEDFESFSTGPIDGQGNWVSPPISGWPNSIAAVVSSPTHSGVRSLHLSGFISTATYTNPNPFQTSSFAAVSFWYREQYGFGTNDTGNNASIRNTIQVSDGYNVQPTNVNICHAGAGHRSVLLTNNFIGNGSCVNGVGDIVEGRWALIEVEYDFKNRVARARVDGGPWGSEIDLWTVDAGYIEWFRPMSIWDEAPQFWFDDLAIVSSPLPPPPAQSPLRPGDGWILTTEEYSNFASRAYFDSAAYKGLNHSGDDLALSPDGSMTASQITYGKQVHPICTGVVERIEGRRKVEESYIQVLHPSCGGHAVVAYYGHLSPCEQVDANCPEALEPGWPVSPTSVLGVVGDWRTNSHLHLTLDTWPDRTLPESSNYVCSHALALYEGRLSITGISGCTKATKLPRGEADKVLLKRIGWGRLTAGPRTDSAGNTQNGPFYITPAAMREFGFVSYFDLLH